MTDSAYAARCRDAVRPAACTRAPECWADRGGSERLHRSEKHGDRQQRCVACNGNVKTAPVPWPPNCALG
ncbi:MAG TPA: hypothetical protein VGR45_01765 [Stellaceae bacterium]|nr:hypothetical protein [Stellaceae bacterium]